MGAQLSDSRFVSGGMQRFHVGFELSIFPLIGYQAPSSLLLGVITDHRSPMTTKPRPEDGSWLTLYSFYPRLVSNARAGGAGADAEDVASTVLMRIVSRGDWPFEVSWPYLSRALRNELIDRHRHLARHRDLAVRMYERPRTASVEEEAIAAVETRRLMSALADKEPERTRAMIRARIEGMTWREVASRFNEPLPAVQARVRRALIRLGRVLLAEQKVA